MASDLTREREPWEQRATKFLIEKLLYSESYTRSENGKREIENLAAFAQDEIASLQKELDEANAHIVKLFNTSEAIAEQRNIAEAELDKWQTLFYESEEYNCSCNVADTSKPIGDPLNYICDWHKQHPHIAEAREIVISLAQRAEKAEAELASARQAERERLVKIVRQISAAWKSRVANGDYRGDPMSVKAAELRADEGQDIANMLERAQAEGKVSK